MTLREFWRLSHDRENPLLLYPRMRSRSLRDYGSFLYVINALVALLLIFDTSLKPQGSRWLFFSLGFTMALLMPALAIYLDGPKNWTRDRLEEFLLTPMSKGEVVAGALWRPVRGAVFLTVPWLITSAYGFMKYVTSREEVLEWPVVIGHFLTMLLGIAVAVRSWLAARDRVVPYVLRILGHATLNVGPAMILVFLMFLLLGFGSELVFGHVRYAERLFLPSVVVAGAFAAWASLNRALRHGEAVLFRSADPGFYAKATWMASRWAAPAVAPSVASGRNASAFLGAMLGAVLVLGASWIWSQAMPVDLDKLPSHFQKYDPQNVAGSRPGKVEHPKEAYLPAIRALAARRAFLSWGAAAAIAFAFPAVYAWLMLRPLRGKPVLASPGGQLRLLAGCWPAAVFPATVALLYFGVFLASQTSQPAELVLALPLLALIAFLAGLLGLLILQTILPHGRRGARAVAWITAGTLLHCLCLYSARLWPTDDIFLYPMEEWGAVLIVLALLLLPIHLLWGWDYLLQRLHEEAVTAESEEQALETTT